jgi:hypothetical protein
MKYKVDWTSPRQGIRSTTVDALGPMQAKEQVESMYAHIEGFNAFCVSPVFEKKEYSEPQESYSSGSSNNDSSSGGDGDSFSTMIGAGAFFIAAIAILFGLFTLPSGIGAMLVGGAIGWFGWKLACFLSDRGW